jgi:hypothetical protein
MSKNIYLGIGFSVVAIGVSLFLMKYIKEEGRDNREALKTIDDAKKAGLITPKEAINKKKEYFGKQVEKPVEKPVAEEQNVAKEYDSDDDLNDLNNPKILEGELDGGKRSKSKKYKSKKSKSKKSKSKKSKSKKSKSKY